MVVVTQLQTRYNGIMYNKHVVEGPETISQVIVTEILTSITSFRSPVTENHRSATKTDNQDTMTEGRITMHKKQGFCEASKMQLEAASLFERKDPLPKFQCGHWEDQKLCQEFTAISDETEKLLLSYIPDSKFVDVASASAFVGRRYAHVHTEEAAAISIVAGCFLCAAKSVEKYHSVLENDGEDGWLRVHLSRAGISVVPPKTALTTTNRYRASVNSRVRSTNAAKATAKPLQQTI